MVRQHFGGWNRPCKMSYLVLNIFYPILLQSSAYAIHCAIALRSVRHPYRLLVNSGAALSRCDHMLEKHGAAHFKICPTQSHKKCIKNQKPSQRRRQSLTCFVVCLLTCKPSYKSDSQIESVVLVVVLLLFCFVLWWNSILTRHSLFSPSADLIILCD